MFFEISMYCLIIKVKRTKYGIRERMKVQTRLYWEKLVEKASKEMGLYDTLANTVPFPLRMK